MAEREQKKKSSPERESEDVQDVPESSESGEKLKADIDVAQQHIIPQLQGKAERARARVATPEAAAVRVAVISLASKIAIESETVPVMFMPSAVFCPRARFAF